jgi:ribose 5-phosphate isomerase
MDQSSLVPLIQQQRYKLVWGTTLIVITGMASDALIDELHQARRGGQNALLILAGRDASDEASHHRAKTFGIPVISITTERDLQIWMQGAKRT